MADRLGNRREHPVPEEGQLTVTHRTTAKSSGPRPTFLPRHREDRNSGAHDQGRRRLLCKEETIEVFIDPDGDGYDTRTAFHLPEHRERIRIPQKTFKYARRPGPGRNFARISTSSSTRHESRPVNKPDDTDLGPCSRSRFVEQARKDRREGRLPRNGRCLGSPSTVRTLRAGRPRMWAFRMGPARSPQLHVPKCTVS